MVYGNRPAVKVTRIHELHCLDNAIIGGHRNEAEAARVVGVVLLHYDPHLDHLTDACWSGS
jgi:hypothetical protein